MNKAYLHLKKDYEFKRAYKKGKTRVSPALVVYCVKKKYGGVRIGITTAKKIGNAVKRSRARRVIREAFRELYPRVRGSWDIVFVARSRTAFVKMQYVRDNMLSQLKELGVITDEEAGN